MMSAIIKKPLCRAFAAVMSVAFTAAAASSPLASASDYIFSAPPSNVVHGVISGPDCDVRTMRAEDVAYLDEALAERAAILCGSTNAIDFCAMRTAPTWVFGDFSAADTNGAIAVVAKDTNGTFSAILVSNQVRYVNFPRSMIPSPENADRRTTTKYLTHRFAYPKALAAGASASLSDYYSPTSTLRATYFCDQAAWPGTLKALCSEPGGLQPYRPAVTNSGNAIVLNGFALAASITNIYGFAGGHTRVGIQTQYSKGYQGGSTKVERIEGNDGDVQEYTYYLPPGELYMGASAIVYEDFETLVEWDSMSHRHLAPVPWLDTRSGEWSKSWGTGGVWAILSCAWLYATTGGVERLHGGDLYTVFEISYSLQDSCSYWDGGARTLHTNITYLCSFPVDHFAETNGLVAAWLRIDSTQAFAPDTIKAVGLPYSDIYDVDVKDIDCPRPTPGHDDYAAHPESSFVLTSWRERRVSWGIRLSDAIYIGEPRFRTTIQSTK